MKSQYKYGFFIAIEMVEDSKKNPATKKASKIVQELKERGILTNTIGPDENILKLRPPMVFTKENATFFLEQLENVVKKFS